MVQDRLAIVNAIGHADRTRKSYIEADWRAGHVDAQRAANDYTEIRRQQMNSMAEESILLGGRPSAIRNWTACMGGDPKDVCKCLLTGSLVLYVAGKSSWTGVICPSAATTPPLERVLFKSHWKTIQSRNVNMLRPSCVDVLSRHVLEHGPMVVAIDSSSLLSATFNGVLNERRSPTEDKRDHVVVAVGWIQHADGRKYWIMRNTWGEDESVKMPIRPHASPYVLADCLAECSLKSKPHDFCDAATWVWKGLDSNKGYFLVDTDHTLNAGCVYSSPCGWVDVMPSGTNALT